jgi:hypothetical protein
VSFSLTADLFAPSSAQMHGAPVRESARWDPDRVDGRKEDTDFLPGRERGSRPQKKSTQLFRGVPPVFCGEQIENRQTILRT